MWESLLGIKTVVRMGSVLIHAAHKCCFCVSSSNDGFKMVFISSRRSAPKTVVLLFHSMLSTHWCKHDEIDMHVYQFTEWWWRWW